MSQLVQKSAAALSAVLIVIASLATITQLPPRTTLQLAATAAPVLA